MHDQFNDSLDEIWQTHLNDVPNLKIPNYFSPLLKGGLLFVGMNPSFNEKATGRFFTATCMSETAAQDSFLWNVTPRMSRETSIAYSEWSRENYLTFFRFHNEIAERCGLTWSHVDLFNFRVTKQKAFKNLLLENEAYKQAQLALFDSVLNYISPHLLLVANAGAANMLKDYYNAEFDQEAGHYFLELGGRIVPTFLSSMLTNGRLDNFSRERLVWHMVRSMHSSNS